MQIYDALEVSRHIINYSNDAGYGITNLKLQKLLYFVQAYFLIKKGCLCFRDNIEAWNFGPVVPSVYREYKRYGAFFAFSVETYIDPLTLKRKRFDDSVISAEDKKLIDSVVDAFADCSNSRLTDLVHGQTPWQEAYRPDHGKVISANAMKKFFA